MEMTNVSLDTKDADSNVENALVDISAEAQQKLEVIHGLLEPCDRATYGQRLRDGAEKLGISVRSLQRIFKEYQNVGLSALVKTNRADKGTYRVGEFWTSFIVKTFNEGNKGSKRMNPKQVAVRVQAKAQEIADVNPPSYKTVLRVLEPIIEKMEKAKSIRSAGWRGDSLSVKTRDGYNLDIHYSNQVWQCDHTRADVILVDKYGQVLSRPWLTTVIDSYSRCVVGMNLGFDAPSSQVVALALRHAILPKNYGTEFKLHCEWGTFGKPEYFFTDGGKDFRSNHLVEIATQLGFVGKLRDRPSEGGIVERVFRTLNDQLFSTLRGYTGSNVQERPEDAEKDASLTLQELERLIVRFFVDSYNQSIDARTGEQTRFQRWEAGLKRIPVILSERELDICLMKIARRSVQRGGYLQFENVMYRGENLGGYAGDVVNLRYDPRDITTIWVYRQEKGQEVFVCRAHAQDLEAESLSLIDAKASAKRLKDAGKAISNNALLQEAIARDALLDSKPSRKDRQKQEQQYKQRSQPVSDEVDSLPVVTKQHSETDADEILDIPSVEDLEVWDYDQLRDESGW